MSAFDKRLQSAIFVNRLHESMDMTLEYLIDHKKCVIDVGHIVKEEAESLGIKQPINAKVLNENILQSIMNYFAKSTGKKPDSQQVINYYKKLNPQQQQALLQYANKEGNLVKIAKLVRDNYKRNLDKWAKSLYNNVSDNNQRTVIASLYTALKNGVDKWTPKLAQVGQKGFDPKSAGLETPKPAPAAQPAAAEEGPDIAQGNYD